MKLSAIISLSTVLLLLALSASCKKGGEGGELANAHGLRAWFLWSQSEDTVEWLKYSIMERLSLS